MNLEFGISIRYPYRPEQLHDIAEEWINGNHQPILEAERLRIAELRARVPTCRVYRKGRWPSSPITKILQMKADGFLLKEIAEATNLSKRTICRILKKQKQSIIPSITIPIKAALKQ